MTTSRASVPGTVSTRRRRGFVAAALVAMLAVGAPDRAAPADGPLAVPAATPDEIDAFFGRGRRGFLYEVVRPATDPEHGKRLFLYGTIHVGRAGSAPFNPPVARALRDSQRLALEADPTDGDTARRLVERLGRYGDGDGLERHLPPPLMARVAAFGEKTGMPSGSLSRFKPWLLANMVALKQASASGLDPDLGSELYLAGFAREVGIPIVEIEGMEAQLRMLAAMPDPLQQAQLDEALTDVDAPAAVDENRALFDLWLTGDAAAGDALVARMHEEASGRVFERYFVETLIDRRNRAMADKAENYLERTGNTFFAVGSLHLFGDSGLIRELARRGYRVIDLQAPFIAPK